MASLNESFYSTPQAKRALKMYENRIKIAESVRKQAGKPALSYEQKLATAVTLSNTARHLKAMESVNLGATQPASIGQYKRFALDMVGTVMPSLIAPDLVGVQAIDNRVGMINVLEYKYGSTKGSAKQGDVFASSLGYQGMNPYYTTASVDGEDLVSGTAPQTLKYTPVKAGTVRIIDGTGAMLVETTDYTISGDTITLTEAGSKKTELKAYYLYDNESVPVTSPQMSLDIKSIPIETHSRKLSAIWAFDAQYELSKEYGADMQQLLATQATAEIKQEIDNEITLDLYRIANAGPEVSWSRIQPLGVNIVDHYDSFWNKIVEGSNQIFAATRRTRANFMVCGLGVDAVLKTMRNFVSSEDLSAVGPHFTGTLGGQIKCYVNPNYDANSFVLGYKGNTLMDTGYVYAPYMPIMTTGMVTLADDFAAREGWATTYGKKSINPRLYVKGRIDG